MDKIELERIRDIGCNTGKFVIQLTLESERSAVILGAAKIDAALEKILLKSLKPSPRKTDDLFGSNRPLSSFSSRINLSHRLGLIDDDLEHCIQMIRRIRNDFAHSIEYESLSKDSHRSRLDEAKNRVSQISKLQFIQTLTGGIQEAHEKREKIFSDELKEFCTILISVLITLEHMTHLIQPISLPLRASLMAGVEYI